MLFLHLRTSFGIQIPQFVCFTDPERYHKWDHPKIFRNNLMKFLRKSINDVSWKSAFLFIYCVPRSFSNNPESVWLTSFSTHSENITLSCKSSMSPPPSWPCTLSINSWKFLVVLVNPAYMSDSKIALALKRKMQLVLLTFGIHWRVLYDFSEDSFRLQMCWNSWNMRPINRSMNMFKTRRKIFSL